MHSLTPRINMDAVTNTNMDAHFNSSSAVNPLVNAASALLLFTTHPSLQREDLAEKIKHFEHEAKLAGVPAMHVLTARYLLCTFTDEHLLNSDWGQDNDWGQHTLLSIFHDDTWGGEQFFSLLEKFQQQPSAYIDLLELIYICLNLGFKGMYRLKDNGATYLESVRQQLYSTISEQRDYTQSDQNEQSEPLLRNQPSFSHSVSKKILLGTLIMLFICFLCFKSSLTYNSNPVRTQLQSIVHTLNNTARNTNEND